MGTAFGVCFTYWIGASGLVFVLTYVCNTHMALIQILSMMASENMSDFLCYTVSHRFTTALVKVE